ncbi:hypothetical protein HYPSUDRAFT_127220 [Hypholoma sublateritium FD-334 SS-4]|uniref:Uncharacterized protein n=1 Tax=Hypholoma sublateritium (strain FD-334 SS-4) TaxID=945553 RepID=A0A0D2QCR3_HYPSF|nr:hypothetical protein HYPSUDRAFT_127220 [Hypholoma sublateritium FD-334 SS-4]
MSDPRFARLKSDPRFRRPKTKTNKVVIDDRFKSVFEKDKTKAGRKVDKYGRPVAKTEAQDNLRRYYRLEGEDEDGAAADEAEARSGDDAEGPRIPDLARGEVLLESSDDEEEEDEDEAGSSDDGFVALGRDAAPRAAAAASDDEIDLDESTSAALAAQAAAYTAHRDEYAEAARDADMERTARLAVVNLDWDHVRAAHLFKICASLVHPTAPRVPASASSSSSRGEEGAPGGPVPVARGRVMSVRVYPSEFGKTRMTREEAEGPPAEIFKKKDVESPEEVNARTVYEVGGEDEYDEDALRKYQLERLRYYYAIVTCDTVDAASHIYNELEGTELERSANVFDISFVPDEMTFDSEPRDEATDEANTTYKAVDFVTDALRHSKVKLTWDDDDPERNHVTRRALTKKEIEENDFRAYIANTSSESEGEDVAPAAQKQTKKKAVRAERDKMRALLLGGNDDAMPEGWGDDAGVGGLGEADDVDMEITFTPGLSAAKAGDETTLEKYQRRMREKRKKRKEEGPEKAAGGKKTAGEGTKEKVDDEFFEAGSENEGRVSAKDKSHKGKSKSRKEGVEEEEKPARREATEEELALLVASSNPDAEPKHFNLKSVIKAEKSKKRRKGRKDKKEDDGEAQEDFAVNVKDDRFKVLFEDHQYAIDPTNPHFKKTKAMSALLDERQKRQRELRDEQPEGAAVKTKATGEVGPKSLQSLVESVKRKSANIDPPGQGKRRKL